MTYAVACIRHNNSFGHHGYAPVSPTMPAEFTKYAS